MIDFQSQPQQNTPLLLPVFKEDAQTHSRKTLEHLTPAQRKAVRIALESQSLPQSGPLPLYTKDGLVILLLVSQDTDTFTMREQGQTIAAIASKYAQASLSVMPGSLWKKKVLWEAFIDGVFLSQYRFDTYKGLLHSKAQEKNPTIQLSSITIVGENKDAHREHWAKGVEITKDCINIPPSVATPSFMEAVARESFAGIPNVKISIVGEKELQKLNAGGILAVGNASDEESRFVVIEYMGGKKGEAPLGFVGKGVTYDTGGLSLKPGASMRGMKKDLGGAATVMGSVYAMAKSQIEKNIVAVIPLAENLIGKKAYKPDDIVTMMNGVTVEITNTDAEGRLLLGDALHYMEKTFSPACIIDAATLTGACAYAVGEDVTAVFANKKELFSQLWKASEKTDEPIWELPLYARYKKLINSKIADIMNAAYGFKAGTIQAALFLQHFVSDTTPWSHFDIAYTASDNKTEMATGQNVRLFLEFAKTASLDSTKKPL